VHVIAIVIGAIWIAFWLFWFLAATTVKSGRTRWRQFAGVRGALVVLVVVLLRLGVFRGHRYVTSSLALGITGLVIFLLGLGLAMWARFYIGRNWGMPMTEKADPELVKTGPYSKIRHPIYSGIILALIGSAIALGVYWFIAAAILGAYFIYSASMEERYLTKTFPDTYPEYKRSTKMLIPYIL
jgi:protein-S-isoprenylcysteine O-methyltransferase Ste14